jgi:hypothetical protein
MRGRAIANDRGEGEAMSDTMKRFLGAAVSIAPTSKGELVALPSIEDETLDELSANILKGHNAIESTLSTAAITAVERGIEIGKRLVRAKKLAGHGNFEAYCAEHFPFTMKTVQNYMRLAKQEAKLRQQLEEKRTRGTFLKMKEALELIDTWQGRKKSRR